MSILKLDPVIIVNITVDNIDQKLIEYVDKVKQELLIRKCENVKINTVITFPSATEIEFKMFIDQL